MKKVQCILLYLFYGCLAGPGSLEKKMWKRNVTLLAFPDVLACTADNELGDKATSEWGGTTVLRV
ncbi:hypothetical protein EXW53_06280 [Bacillus mycoides]|nr:hypothetical protein EXW53_06280 [Bacillus mycoides]